MFNSIRKMFVSEKCFTCGRVTAEGKTSVDNKFTCINCLVQPQEIVSQVFQSQQLPPPLQLIEKVQYNDNGLDKTQNESLAFFSNVYGLDSVKEIVYLTVTADNPTHRLLVGRPGCAKSVIGMTVCKKMKDAIYFDAANMSGAGLIDTLSLHRNARVLVIDEIDKLNKRDLNCLLGLLANGIVVKTLKGNRTTFEMNVRVIATSNSTNKLSPAILSRFLKTIIPEYKDDDFKKVCEFCLKDRLPVVTTNAIADAVLSHGKKDVRTVLSIGQLIKKHHDAEDIKRIVDIEMQSNNDEVVDFN